MKRIALRWLLRIDVGFCFRIYTCLALISAGIICHQLLRAQRQFDAYVQRSVEHHERRKDGTPAEYGEFYLDYRLATSREGNSVAVAGFWQESGENLPHSSALFTLDPSSGEIRRIYSGSLATYQTIWQPGGKRMAFTGNSFSYSGGNVALPLIIVDVATGTKTEIVVPEQNRWYVNYVAWSPDGRWLAYNRALWPYTNQKVDDLGTWIVSSDGTQHYRLPLPKNVERLELVGWRPGKSELYLSEGYPYTDRQLWLAPVAGGAKKIATPATYAAFVDTPVQGNYFATRTLEKSGSMSMHRVRTFKTSGSPTLDLGLIDQTGDARWSSDGKWLAYANRAPVGGWVTLRLIRGDGSETKEWQPGYGTEYQPTKIFWSPDNKQMLVTSEKQSVIDIGKGNVTWYEIPFLLWGWRSDKRLIGISQKGVAILKQNGKTEKLFPKDQFVATE